MTEIIAFSPQNSSELLAFQRYMAALETAPVCLSPPHSQAVQQRWIELRASLGPSLPLPSVGPTADGDLQFAWSRKDRYVDIDIHPDGTFEWFATNRETGEHQGSEDENLTALPDTLLDWLRGL